MRRNSIGHLSAHPSIPLNGSTSAVAAASSASHSHSRAAGGDSSMSNGTVEPTPSEMFGGNGTGTLRRGVLKGNRK